MEFVQVRFNLHVVEDLILRIADSNQSQGRSLYTIYRRILESLIPSGQLVSSAL